jgi:hypothetical protein
MTMADPITVASRATAEQLAADYGTALAADVEAALHAHRTGQRPGQYIDPASLGSLIVATATLAWTIYADLRRKTPAQPPETLGRQISIHVNGSEHSTRPGDEVGRITSIVITEIIHAAGELTGTPERHAEPPDRQQPTGDLSGN